MYQRIYQRNKARDERVAVLMLLGGQCERCGFNDSRALQIDHVHGGGNRERDKGKRSRNTLKVLREKWVRAMYGELQVLCANCNWIKRAERGEVRVG